MNWLNKHPTLAMIFWVVVVLSIAILIIWMMPIGVEYIFKLFGVQH